MWKRITIVSSIVRSPDVNVPENGYLTPEYYTENQTIAKKTVVDFAVIMWDEGQNPRTITLTGKRFPFSLPFTGILKWENGKPNRFSVTRFLIFIFRLHFVSCCGRKRKQKRRKNTLSLSVSLSVSTRRKAFSFFRFASSAADRNENKNEENGTRFQDSSSILEMGNSKSQNDHVFRFLMLFIPFYRKWKTHIGLLLWITCWVLQKADKEVIVFRFSFVSLLETKNTTREIKK